MLRRTYAIAVNTFREAVRDRVLVAMLGLGGALLFFTLVLAQMSLHQERRVVLDLGLAVISLCSVFMALFLGASLLYKEIERKTLYVVLPKPVRRYEFILGKYVGILLTVSAFVAILGGTAILVAALQLGAPAGWTLGLPILWAGLLGVSFWRLPDRTAVLLPWSALFLGLAAWLSKNTDLELSPILAALLLNVGEVAVLVALALLFSSFSTPALTGVLSFGIWLVGRSAADMAAMKSEALSRQVRAALHGLAKVVPNLNLFVPGRHTLEHYAADGGGPWLYVVETMAYAAIYSAVLLLLAMVIFRRRDLL